MPKIGVLLTDVTDGKQVVLVEFDGSGMLVMNNLQADIVWQAMRSLERHVVEGVGNEPLYQKYADLLKQTPTLPDDILEKEAAAYAEAVNRADPPCRVNQYSVKAQVMHFSGLRRHG